MRKTMVLAVALTATLTSFGSANAASPCIRHIVNHYGGTWTFDVSNNFGNVVMIPISKDGKAKVPPKSKDKPKKDSIAVIGGGQAWEIIYNFGFLNISDGTMKITDVNNVSHSYHYSSFFGGMCPNINHDGATGAVDLNDPAKGDVSIDAFSWDGSKVAPTGH